MENKRDTGRLIGKRDAVAKSHAARNGIPIWIAPRDNNQPGLIPHYFLSISSCRRVPFVLLLIPGRTNWAPLPCVRALLSATRSGNRECRIAACPKRLKPNGKTKVCTKNARRMASHSRACCARLAERLDEKQVWNAPTKMLTREPKMSIAIRKNFEQIQRSTVCVVVVSFFIAFFLLLFFILPIILIIGGIISLRDIINLRSLIAKSGLFARE